KKPKRAMNIIPEREKWVKKEVCIL
ncbi:MAG: hypothetical protein RL181_844, partial [Bacteroidota bacterium]